MTNLLKRELFIPGDATNLPPENSFLFVNLQDRFGLENKCHYFRQANGTEIMGCPEILKGKEFIGYREIYWYAPINVMIRLIEFYPIPGRIWTKFYNNGTWSSWGSIIPT